MGHEHARGGEDSGLGLDASAQNREPLAHRELDDPMLVVRRTHQHASPEVELDLARQVSKPRVDAERAKARPERFRGERCLDRAKYPGTPLLALGRRQSSIFAQIFLMFSRNDNRAQCSAPQPDGLNGRPDRSA